jgi:hypothetical protein
VDPDIESDKPANEKAALAGGSLRKAESRAYPTVSGLVKQLSHLLCAAPRNDLSLAHAHRRSSRSQSESGIGALRFGRERRPR